MQMYVVVPCQCVRYKLLPLVYIFMILGVLHRVYILLVSLHIIVKLRSLIAFIVGHQDMTS